MMNDLPNSIIKRDWDLIKDKLHLPIRVLFIFFKVVLFIMAIFTISLYGSYLSELTGNAWFFIWGVFATFLVIYELTKMMEMMPY